MNPNTPMKPINQSNIPSPAHKETGQDIEFLTHVISSDSHISTPVNPHNPLATIAYSPSSTSNTSSTKNYKQDSSLPSPSSIPPLPDITLSLDNSQSSTPPPPDLTILLEYFLFSDLTTDRPDLEKWKNGYKDSRIITDKSSNYLIVPVRSGINGGSGIREERDIDCEEGHWDIFKIPDKSHGGLKELVFCRTFTSKQIDDLEKMMGCEYDPEHGKYPCQICPKCLRNKSKRRNFVNQRAEIRRQEEIISDLEKWIKDKGYISELRKEFVRLYKSGHKHRARIWRSRIGRLEEGISNPQTNIFYAELSLEKLQQKAKILKDSAELSDEPHSFISVCTPSPLHVLYDAQDEWFDQEAPKPIEKHSPAIRGILEGLEGKEMGFRDMLRYAFRYLAVDAVKKQFPEVELTYEQQMHPFGKYDLAPDVHFLIRNTVLEAGDIRELSFDVNTLRKDVGDNMKIFKEFVLWMIMRLNKADSTSVDGKKKKCRATAYVNWKMRVEKAAEEIETRGISAKTVDIRVREPNELLGTHVYLRKYPTQNIKRVEFDKDKGMVDVYYWQKDWTKDGRKAEIGVIDLAWRLVGFDLRKCGVQCSGDYRSDRNMTRKEKLEAYEDAKEQILRNRIEAMRQEIRRQATVD